MSAPDGFRFDRIDAETIVQAIALHSRPGWLVMLLGRRLVVAHASAAGFTARVPGVRAERRKLSALVRKVVDEQSQREAA
jgi:hypothetical protein